MTRSATAGKMQDYVANLEFALNFEDRKNSVKVKMNEIVKYDGMTAVYKKENGTEVSGRAPSLQAAINNNWLSLNTKGARAAITNINIRAEKVRGDNIQYKQADFDPIKGGSFEGFLKNDAVQHDGSVIAEEDQIVKRTPPTSANVKKVGASKTSAKREVSGDQVAVRNTSLVSNSTSKAPAIANRKVTVSHDDGFVSETSISKDPSLKNATSVSKKRGFTVDKNTPAVPADATLAEVKRSITRVENEQQEAKVVKKTARRVVVESPDADSRIAGQTMSSEEEGITFRKAGRPKDSNEPQVKVSQGSEAIADLSGVNTQEEVDAVENEIAKKAAVIPNYLDMLPDDWAAMHWVAKEKFIRAITDKGFLKFLMRVETVKAVQDACKARLTELLKK